MALIAVLVLAVPGVSFADSSQKNNIYHHTTPHNDGESFWQRLIPKFSTAGRPNVTGDLTPEPNWKNAGAQAHRKSRKSTARTAARRSTKTPPGRSRKRAPTKLARKGPAKGTEAWWWENVGNPPVDALSKCLSTYAGEAVKHNADMKAADVVKEAVAGACRPKYDEMVNVMSHGLTKARYDKAMVELHHYTFLPAVTAVLKRQRPAAAPASVTATLAPGSKEVPDVEARKQAMFDCFNREADALALQNPAGATVLAREVVARCDEETRGFFAALFAAYPVDKKAHEASIAIAVQQNYMPAIARRISIVRQGQPAISRDNTSGSAEDTRARTTVVTEQ